MARSRFDAVAVGDAIFDIINPPLRRTGPGDRQSRVERFRYLPGGNATNFALAFAALGGRTGFVGCLGKDWGAGALRDAYRAGRVETRLPESSAKGTGTTMAVTYSDGTRHLITAPGANADLRLSHVPRSWIAGTRHLHRAGFWWATGLMGLPTVRLLSRAEAAGATTSLDVSTDPEGWPRRRREAALHALPHVGTFFGNEEEVTRLAGTSSLPRAARALLGRGVDEVVVHRGRLGATRFARSGSTSAPGFRVRAMNPTGCGDVFNAAYVRATLAGLAPDARLRFANAAAAWHLENPSTPYPSLREIRVRFRVSLESPPAGTRGT